MVDLDGGRVAAEVTGGEEPTVVLVSQIGTGGSSWSPVTQLLTTRPRLVSYDRPGIGASPPRPAPNPPLPYSTFATELVTMLDRLDVTEPVVAVGHSFGSLIVRMFAAQHPNRVAGMVHVDGSVPSLRLWPGSDPIADGDGPAATEFDLIAGEAEMAGILLPDVPGVVLARAPGRWDVSVPDPGIDGFWQDAQANLAHQTGAELVVAADAGHQMPREAPELVAFAIDEVVESVRGRRAVRIGPRAAAVGARITD